MRKYGLIGTSLKHSFSKDFFTHFFAQNSIEASYENIELDNLNTVRQLIFNQSFHGLNVTIPYKEKIIPFMDELTSEAKAIGAINVITVKKDKLIGSNTDAFGFRQMIKPFLKNTHQKALIIGNGGASKAIKYVLHSIGLDIVTAARTPKEGEYKLSEVNEWMLQFCTLVINTTPVGMFPNQADELPIPHSFFNANHLVIDLIYNPQETMLLKHAKALGAVTLNGSTMLQQQALKAWELWNEPT